MTIVAFIIGIMLGIVCHICYEVDAHVKRIKRSEAIERHRKARECSE
ncbi:MAG: hypothetical protein Q4F79_12430 [Eubacteriales bacterium]|nr:hypothetical protein [Eubacteriales bacterium]